MEDQLRDLIIHGMLSPGDQLPTESELSLQFNVARGTVREALGRLASEGLVIKKRGAKGGTFAAAPTTQTVLQTLTGTISLMAASRELTTAELLETRELLEVPAVRLAARRRGEADLKLLRDAVPMESADRSQRRQFATNAGFHEQILVACGNRLLRLATEPIFVTLQTRSLGDRVPSEFWDQVTDDHHAILVAVEAGDPEAAAAAMSAHLQRLRPTYEQLDKELFGSPAAAG